MTEEEGEYFVPQIISFNGIYVIGDAALLINIFNMLLKKDYRGVQSQTGICHSYDGCH
jgi:hypothetical protein